MSFGSKLHTCCLTGRRERTENSFVLSLRLYKLVLTENYFLFIRRLSRDWTNHERENHHLSMLALAVAALLRWVSVVGDSLIGKSENSPCKASEVVREKAQNYKWNSLSSLVLFSWLVISANRINSNANTIRLISLMRFNLLLNASRREFEISINWWIGVGALALNLSMRKKNGFYVCEMFFDSMT